MFDCKGCKARDEEITRLYLSIGEDKKCPACASKEDLIKYLREELERRTNEWRTERRELKLVIDRLLEKSGVAPVGLGRPEVSLTAEQVLKASTSVFDEVAD